MVDKLLESSEKAYLPKVASPTNHGRGSVESGSDLDPSSKE